MPGSAAGSIMPCCMLRLLYTPKVGDGGKVVAKGKQMAYETLEQ